MAWQAVNLLQSQGQLQSQAMSCGSCLFSKGCSCWQRHRTDTLGCNTSGETQEKGQSPDLARLHHDIISPPLSTSNAVSYPPALIWKLPPLLNYLNCLLQVSTFDILQPLSFVVYCLNGLESREWKQLHLNSHILNCYKLLQWFLREGARRLITWYLLKCMIKYMISTLKLTTG